MAKACLAVKFEAAFAGRCHPGGAAAASNPGLHHGGQAAAALLGLSRRPFTRTCDVLQGEEACRFRARESEAVVSDSDTRIFPSWMTSSPIL